jgi:hypothetical protein
LRVRRAAQAGQRLLDFMGGVAQMRKQVAVQFHDGP